MATTHHASPRPLIEFLAEVPDHRQNNRSHPLSAVLALTTCAMLCGARSLYAAAQWGRDHGGAVAAALGFRREKTPCVATLHNVLKAMDAAAFEAALARWLAQAQPAVADKVKAVAIDGKTLRGSQGHQLPGVHLLAAFSARLGLPVTQVQTGRGPGGELAAASELLAKLDLAGVVVTGDALFAQRELCAAITKKGATTCSRSRPTSVTCRKASRPSLRTRRLRVWSSPRPARPARTPTGWKPARCARGPA